MSIRLEVEVTSAAPLARVWELLIDWEGQRRWIPFTTVQPTAERRAGIGTRVSALSGFRLGRVPVGLLDRFVVTGWRPPTDGRAELEVLHLGPYFTGPGVFSLASDRASDRASDHGLSEAGTSIHCVELFDLPGAPLTEAAARATLPIMRAGFRHSLHQLAALAERP